MRLNGNDTKTMTPIEMAEVIAHNTITMFDDGNYLLQYL